MSNFREYAILFHDCPQNLHGPSTLRDGALPHWDLLIEPKHPNNAESHPLLCFEVLIPPSQWSSVEITVEKLGDHRLTYLSYEGPLTGDRGTVSRVDRGGATWIKQDDAEMVLDMTSQTTRHNQPGQMPSLLFQSRKLTLKRISMSAKWRMRLD